MTRVTPSRRRPLAAGVVALLGAALLPPTAASASSTVEVSSRIAATWGTNGRVLAIAPWGTKAVIGGTFTQVTGRNGETRPASNLAIYDSLTGEFLTTPMGTDGEVTSLDVEGDTLYAAGSFKNVNGAWQKFAAALSLSTGQRIPGFSPTSDLPIKTIDYDGGKVYLGGAMLRFKDAAGWYDRPYIARVDPLTGARDASWTPVVNGSVWDTLVAPDGSGVYLGGDFTTVSTDSRYTRLAKVSASTGAPVSTFVSGPTNLTVRAPIRSIETNGPTVLVATTGSGGACALLNSTTGATIWNKHGNGDMQSAVYFGPNAYCGGHFSGSASFDGLDRQKLAAVNLATGTTTAYAPGINSALGLFSLEAGPDALYVGGDFTKVDTVDQSQFGQLRALDAQLPPSTPPSLTASPSDGVVSLAWGEPSTDGGPGILEYRVYRATAGSSAGAVLVGSSPTRSFADTTVTNGVTYSYSVVAHNQVGDSPASTAVGATPVGSLVAPPSAPLSFTAIGNVGTAVLSWAPPAQNGGAPVTGYRVYRSLTTGAQTPYADLDASATGYTDTAVTVGTRYYYTVSALNSAGEGPLSSEASAVPNTGVPSAPTLSLVSVGPGTVTLSWTAPVYTGSPITKYVLVRDGVRVDPQPTLTAMGYTDVNVPAGLRSYQVRAVNSYGTSKFSNTVKVTVP